MDTLMENLLKRGNGTISLHSIVYQIKELLNIMESNLFPEESQRQTIIMIISIISSFIAKGILKFLILPIVTVTDGIPGPKK